MLPRLIDWSLRAALMAAGTGAILCALRLRAPAPRHLAWTALLAAMILLPAWTVWGPSVAAPMLPPAAVAQLAKSVEVPAGQPSFVSAPAARFAAPVLTAPASDWSWRWLPLAVYLAGLAVMAIRLAVGTARARAITLRAKLRDGVLASPDCAVPLTAGWLQPVVILPDSWRQWPPSQLEAVLAHEREHVRRRDPLVQWIALANRCIFWFHPLAWWLEKKLAALAEEACDAAVLARGHNRHDYAAYLIDLARSVERAGARVHPACGVGIDGSALSARIHRILDGNPAPPVSPVRATLAAALCVVVLAAFAACRLERASQPAPGQPTMNELMHRRTDPRSGEKKQWQAMLLAARNMTPAQASALEGQVKSTPDDRDALIRLVRYYQIKGDLKALDALTLWYAEHRPEMPWAWNVPPAWDRLAYDRDKQLWLAHLKKPGAGAAVYRNAAAFLEGGDKPQAERILLAGQKAYPSEDWDTALGMHYAQALLGSVGPKAEYNVIREVSMKDAHDGYSRSVRATLDASGDPRLLMQTAQWLTAWSSHLLFVNSPFDFDPLALARTYNDRALALQPDNPGALSLKLQIDEVAAALRIRRTRPAQLAISDRLKSLEGQPSKARELLALAAQYPTDPEYGNAIFFANLSLGEDALQHRDKREAARRLLAAAAAPATSRLRYGYIDMTLARQLVDWGERETVAQFLDRCAKFNYRSQQLAGWAAGIRKGINPDLTPYHTEPVPGAA